MHTYVKLCVYVNIHAHILYLSQYTYKLFDLAATNEVLKEYMFGISRKKISKNEANKSSLEILRNDSNLSFLMCKTYNYFLNILEVHD